MGVSEWVGTVSNWRFELEQLKSALAPALGRVETRRSAGAFIDGLLSSAE